MTWLAEQSIDAGIHLPPGDLMRTLRGTNVTIFALFFGLTLLEALQTRDWLRAVFWLAIGLVFLRADGLRRET